MQTDRSVSADKSNAVLWLVCSLEVVACLAVELAQDLARLGHWEEG